MAKYWVYKTLINLGFIGAMGYGLYQRKTFGLIVLITAWIIFSILLILNDRFNRKDKRKVKEKEI